MTNSERRDLLDERHLLLLGLLMAQSRHGYQVNEFISTNLGRVSNMKPATAYALLKRLEKQGLVSSVTETVGNHPPRNVYSITPLGKEHFHELLQQLVVQVDPQSSSADIAIMFLDHLQPGEVISLLRKRLSDLRSNLIQLEKTPRHANARGVDLAVSRKLALLRAEEEWLRRTIAELELSSKRSEQS